MENIDTNTSIDAVTSLIETLKPLSPEGQERVIRTVMVFLDIPALRIPTQQPYTGIRSGGNVETVLRGMRP